jgi:hypothetical protein
MRARCRLILAIALAAPAFAGCFTTRTGPAATPPRVVEYAGTGQDPSLLGAMNRARMDAVRKAVVELIGAAAELANRATLAAQLYETRNPGFSIIDERYATTRKDMVGGDYLVEARVLVRIEAVAAALRSLGLMGTAGTAETTGTSAMAGTGPAAAVGTGPEGVTSRGAAGAGSAADGGPASATDEERFIRDRVERMSWVVYFVERKGVNPSAMRTAVGIANGYLAENAMKAVDLSRIEKLRKDQHETWKAETGESIGIVPWIARTLDADVYLEIDGTTAVTRSKNRWSAAASIVLTIYEAATARRLGSVPWTSPAGAWQQTEAAAVGTVLQASVEQAMPIAVGQAKAGFAAGLREGITYSLVLQRTTDATAVSAFRNRLKERVKGLKTVSQADEGTTFEVRLVGSIEDLADLVVSVAGKVPGLEGLRKVMLRGTSITFTTGM